jgi:DNA polymerase/3'-5' exonuclease PolX|tara:strand:- start:1603 stop:1899 length:297 start_codon:yes stop_codon:yes gene_type:complete
MSKNSNNDTPDEIEFKMLEANVDGSDEVTFQLEDGSIIKIRVNIDRAGVATNYHNSDGSKHYNVQASMSVNVISSDRTYKLSKPGMKSDKSVVSKPYK